MLYAKKSKTRTAQQSSKWSSVWMQRAQTWLLLTRGLL
jgi:hypothetical protein